MKFVLLLAGGIIGTLLRYLVAEWAVLVFSTAFPFGTLIINASGSLIIGLLWGVMEPGGMSPNARAFLFIGILGGFTTFSSFALEALNLLRNGDIKIALAYIAGTNVSGLLLVFGGFFLGRYIYNFVQ